jgi:AhpD family alkylhydroperoxidase
MISITKQALHEPVATTTAAEERTMQTFPVHTIESAPEQSKPPLQMLRQAFGMIPNIAGAMSTSPVLIGSLVGLFQKVHGGSFSEQQIQILLLTNAVTNGCGWAVAFHTALALKEGVEQADVQAIRERQTPRSPKSAALSVLARTLIENRGRLNELDVTRFLQAGFDKAQLLEVIAVTAASTITNYTGNVAKPPLEAAFEAYAWSAK